MCGQFEGDCFGLLWIEIFDGDLAPVSTLLAGAYYEEVDLTIGPAPYTIDAPLGVVYVTAVLSLQGDKLEPVTNDLVQRFGLEVRVSRGVTSTLDLTVDSRIP